jgi:hypothetical protein
MSGNEDGSRDPSFRAFGYLYSLIRFVEVAMRFPSKKEQGALLEKTFSSSQVQDLDLNLILKRASETSQSKKLRRLQKERSRKYR